MADDYDDDFDDFTFENDKSADQDTIEIYNPCNIRRKLAEDLEDALADSDGILSNEEIALRKRLKALVRERSQARRRLLIADR